MPTTPINGLPSPDDNSPNRPPIHFDALNAVLDSRLIARFPTANARDAAITAPVNGMECWLDSPGSFSRRIGGQWITDLLRVPHVGWSNWVPNTTFPAGPDTGEVPPGVALIGWGTVGMEGVMFAGNGVAAGTTCANIPAPFRPSSPRPVFGNLMNVLDNESLNPRRVRFDIQTNGNLVIKRGLNAEEGDYISFHGQSYSL